MRNKIPHRFWLAILCIVSFLFFVILVMEIRIAPLLRSSAGTKAKLYAGELITGAVNRSLAQVDGKLVNVTYADGCVSSIEADMPAIVALRNQTASLLAEKLGNSENLSFSLPIGNLFGMKLFSGKGIPVTAKIVPVGDVSTELYSELTESGINQTLHRIYLRIRVELDVIVANESVRLDFANNVCVAETVIVGKVPDAYTAINRFEIDENEENDLNDYAATLP